MNTNGARVITPAQAEIYRMQFYFLFEDEVEEVLRMLRERQPGKDNSREGRLLDKLAQVARALHEFEDTRVVLDIPGGPRLVFDPASDQVHQR